MRYFKTQFQICLKHFLYAQPNYSNGANTHYLKVKPVNHYFKLLIDESFKDLRSSIYTEIAENRREPFDHAIKYLISSNKLLDVEALLHKDLKGKAPLIEPNLRRNLGKWST
ncbi:hypothetical protein KBW96_14880 [Acinetobacter baumannii]|uniref:hypothetical protein n=1 Tax=Acinetobacter baumannii TaxID=470 RepID=UPI001B3798E6|nr:hypothetical protein [Acinetobacter baumannii]MBQ0858617.1 hypothetical protein [Acinetobacter baumannii]MBQ0875335.1 hypothetical protein [Acinetobacter baumannii]